MKKKKNLLKINNLNNEIKANAQTTDRTTLKWIHENRRQKAK